MKPFEIWSQVNKTEDISKITGRFKKLEDMSYSDLQALPDEQVESINSDPRGSRFSIYRITIDEDKLGIILQMYIPIRSLILVKFAQVIAVGFCVIANGEKRPVSEEVLYGYM